MNSRRNFIRSSSLILLGLPAATQASSFLNENPLAGFPAESDPNYWEQIRGFFMIPPDEAYLNTGTIGATPSPVLHAMVSHLQKVATDIAREDWSGGGQDLLSGYFPYPDLRKKLGSIVNAEAGNISLIQNAHMGMNTMALGLDMKRGDEVIQTNMEHTGGSSGWQVRARRDGIVIKQISIVSPIKNPEQIIDLIEKTITRKTKVIAIPHILSGTGEILPVNQICALAREKGILTVIDGAQTIGHIPLNFKEMDCDAYFTSPHKWLLAPAGSGMLFIKPELSARIQPSMPSGSWDNHEDEGFRFTQRGTSNEAMMKGYEAAVDFHLKIGNKRITERIKYLGDYLRSKLQEIDKVEILTSIHPELSSGMTTFGVKGVKGEELRAAMWEKYKLQPRPVGPDGNFIRFSTHIYNSSEEINKALAVTNEIG
jgi:isopenicillin-N epimerase